MRILHIAPNATYNVSWGFHENLLPKYHKKMGHDVTIIVPNLIHHEGQIILTQCLDPVVDEGVNVIRMVKKRYWHPFITNICSKLEVYEYLKESRPDYIFYHGLNSTTIFDVIKYKKYDNPECIIVQDNHIDENNAYKPGKIKWRILRAFYRHIVRKTIPYVEKVYGVTPWRKTYAKEYYNVPESKLDVLIMGADDEKMDFANKSKIRSKIRNHYGVSQEEFLIVTGGKIDEKKNIHHLIEGCKNLPNVKLLIFGSISESIRDVFNDLLLKNDNVIYIGWVAAENVYNYFFSADLVFFPGGHSVMWEQACASKIPCVFKKWDEIEHLNNGGNCDFIYPITPTRIRSKVIELLYTPKYYTMKRIAESTATDIYRYTDIAEKTMGFLKKNETGDIV